ncbi:hypothetical protein [Verrucomicrobium spinosum]|uniref:hypothetical protein n=1 Tax=Verrucomicrobium spinosum TaxID=2736 RepID=UPI0009467013|nr:hypothetical protein [Verrucomicrobium spinosum]
MGRAARHLAHFLLRGLHGAGGVERCGIGQAQGAAWELPADFLSGAQRGRFHGQDGQLYVSGMYGWGCYGPKDGCLQRVRFTGGTQPLPVGWEVRRNGDDYL